MKPNTKGLRRVEVLLFLAVCISIAWCFYFAVVTISMPYQIEYREGAAQVMTGFLLARSNPFVLENQPLGMNNYGMGYNLAVTPFAYLFGNTLLVHRSITFVFILLAALTGAWVVYRHGDTKASALACAAFIMIALIGRGGIGAAPAAMGTFLLLLTISIPFLYRFTTASLVASVVFSLAAFYTKPYFVLGMGIVAAYLFLFASKRTGLGYAALFLLLFAGSFLVVRWVFPFYFINTVIGNISNTGLSYPHMISQLKDLGIYFLPIILLSILFLASDMRNFRRGTGTMFDIREWKQPLIKIPFDYYFFSFLCTLLVFIFFLGPHVGNYLNYAYQLILPVFFCWFFPRIGRQEKQVFVITGLVILNLILWNGIVLPFHVLEQKGSREWSRLQNYVQSSSNILNSPLITSTTIESGLNPLDSGQITYFYIIKPYPESAILGPSYTLLRADGMQYLRSVDNSIEKQKFDLIFTTLEKNTFYHMKLVSEFYTPIDEIRVDMPQTEQQWTVVVWKPISK